MAQQSGFAVEEIYKGVIGNVISQVREAFLDEGIDVDVLQQLKKSWESKIQSSGAVDLDGSARQQQQLPAPTPIVLRHPKQQVILTTAAAASSWDANIQPTVAVDLASLTRQQIPAPTSLVLQQPKQQNSSKEIPQLDGGGPGMTDSSSEDEPEDDDRLNRYAGLEGETAHHEGGEQEDEEEPLNSGDDQSDDEDLETLFDADNVVVCQFEKVHRARNKWKFILKDGIMQIQGKDYCFHKSNGEAEW